MRTMKKGTYIRQASHCGSWYTKSSETLDSQLTCWLSEASTASLSTPRKGSVRALIAPHAGYSYSGPTAAYAYMHLDPTLIRRIFILGPSHHVHLKACAVSGASVCATPIGDLTVDEAVRAELLANPLFQRMTQGVDEDEHSIEMHLPYVAHRIGATQGITIVPVMVGALDPAQEAEYGRYVCYYVRVARECLCDVAVERASFTILPFLPSCLLMLETHVSHPLTYPPILPFAHPSIHSLFAPYLSEPSNFFIISTDFCHWGRRFAYQPYDSSYGATIADYIEWLDKQGMGLIEEGDPKAFTTYLRKHQNTICGRHPISVFLHAAKAYREGEGGREEIRVGFVRYAQSSKCVSRQDSSVSYASAVATVSANGGNGGKMG